MTKEAKPELKKWNITYHRVRILVPYPRNIRKGECVVCHRKKGEGIKVTQLHHTFYEFMVETVRKNPLLALKNTIEACFPCHQIADGFRNILDETSMDRMMWVAVLLPENQLRKLADFCRIFLKWYNNGEKD